MPFDLLETLGNVLNVLNLFGSSSSSTGVNYPDKQAKKKRTKYFTEKISAGFLTVAAVLFFFVFKDPLPDEHYTQTLIVGSLIGTVVSGLLFFILHVLKLYYFKSLFKLLLFSGSVIIFFISLVLCIYFKSSLFI